jgi:phage portal protein BeeE
VFRRRPGRGGRRDWWTPNWGAGTNLQQLTDTAWLCVDINSNLLATMPPYLVERGAGVGRRLDDNPDPDLYTSWEEFAKQLFWDYQLGEAFVISTASYATGWPARFHVVPPWLVDVEMDAGRRRYTIGSVDVSGDILHLRYTSNVSDAHGHGPLEAGAGRLVAAQMLSGTRPVSPPQAASPRRSSSTRRRWMRNRRTCCGSSG